MALQLIEKWQLAVLHVRLDLATRNPAVATELTAYPGGTATTLWERRYPVSAFGLDVAPPTKLVVPSDLRRRVVASLVDDLQGEAALWLRLVPPYGYLGAVPWERDLVKASGLPMLRVPDRLPLATDLGRTWRAAIAICAQPRSRWAAAYVRALSDSWRWRVPGTVEVDVFADAGTAAALRADPVGPAVRVHDPADARPAALAAADREVSRNQASTKTVFYGEPPAGRLWADWIRAGLEGQAVRALHIVLDGALDDDRAVLLVAPDPARPVPRSRCSTVDPASILALADGIGSAALSFASPPRNPDELATRMVADAVGQQRPGATIYSSVAADPEGRGLAAAHAFAVDRSGELPIPRDPALFAYLQPEQAQASLTMAMPTWNAVPDDVGGEAGRSLTAGLETRFAQAESVPQWVASWDRLLGSQSAGLAAQIAAPEPTAALKSAYNKGATEALSQLRDILDRHAKPS